MRRADVFALVALAACGRVDFDRLVDATTTGGTFLVAGNYASPGAITAYRIDPATGDLVATGQGAIATADAPLYPAATPDGRFIYFPHETMAGSFVSGFAVGSDGFLTLLPGSPYDGSGVFDQIVVMHPSGKFLYVSGMGGIQCYAIDADGALVKAQAPATVPMGFQMAIDPQGEFLFQGAYGNGLVYGFHIESNCALTSTGAASANTSLDLHGIAVDRQGQFVVVQSTVDISVYAIDRSSGSISLAQGPYPNDGYWLTFDPPGTHLLVAARNAGIRSYAFDRATGALSSTSGSPFHNGSNGMYWYVALDATGTFAYAASDADLELDPFRLDANGALAPLATVPATALAYGMAIVTPP